MDVTASQVIEKAMSYVGLKESPPNSNNVVFNTDYYNHPVNDPALSWCCVMWWDIFRMLNASELFYSGNRTASCTTLMNYGKQNGLFVDSKYKTGDLIFFNWSGNKNIAEHIGMFLGTNQDGSLHTIEGNTAVGNDSNGGEVMIRDRSLSVVIGGYRPKYVVEINKDEDENMVRYQRLSNIPNENKFRDIIEILMNAKIINGDGSDPIGNNDIIDLSQDQVRSLVFEYRGGAFDRRLIAQGLSPAVNV